MSLSTPLMPSIKRLLTTVTVIGANSLSIGPIAPGIAVDLEASVPTALIATASYGIGTAPSAFLIAPYIDRIGIRASLLRPVAILSCAFLVERGCSRTCMVDGRITFSRCCRGCRTASLLCLCTEIAPKHQQSKITGMVLTGWTISMVAGVGLATFVADYMSWRTVYFTPGIAAAIISAGVFLSALPVDFRGDFFLGACIAVGHRR